MTHHPRTALRLSACLALAALAACADRTPLSPVVPGTLPTALTRVECRATVAQHKLECVRLDPVQVNPSVRGDRIYGGQDVYVKLSSANTAYDGGTQIFSSNVTVENLASQSIGTSDGTTVSGVDVFFASGPTVTSGGAGSSVAVSNYDGISTFTNTGQRYFKYNQILAPYQVSNARAWQFQITGSVSTFVFTVYISAPMPNEAAPLLDKVWQGDVSALWSTAGNWADNAVPDSSSVVTIPSDSLLAPTDSLPRLTGAADVAALRVGTASTLDLGGYTLRARGNVDATGTVKNGTLWMSGTGALVNGSVPALQVTGSAAVQKAVVAGGAVSVTGSLAVSGNPLSIKLP
jgi:hypothetical protein